MGDHYYDTSMQNGSSCGTYCISSRMQDRTLFCKWFLRPQCQHPQLHLGCPSLVSMCPFFESSPLCSQSEKVETSLASSPITVSSVATWNASGFSFNPIASEYVCPLKSLPFLCSRGVMNLESGRWREHTIMGRHFLVPPTLQIKRTLQNMTTGNKTTGNDGGITVPTPVHFLSRWRKQSS